MTPAVIMAASSTKAYWYLARGTGAVALMATTASFALGIATSLNWWSRRVPRLVVNMLHRNISLFVVAFLVVHIGASVFDSFVTIRWIDGVVPFAADYRPIWLGLGALSFDIMIAACVTSLLRVRIGYRTWRLVHWTSYAAFPIAIAHSLGSGTDVKERWLQVVMILTSGVAVAMVAMRVLTRPNLQAPAVASPGVGSRNRAAALIALVLTPIGLTALAAAGPLRSGWAHSRAATFGSATNSAAAPAVSDPSPLVDGFTSAYDGTVTQGRNASGQVQVVIAAKLQTATASAMTITLLGRAQNGVFAYDSGTLTINDTTTIWSGTSSALDGTALTASATDPVGSALALQIFMRFDRTGTAVGGTVTATPIASPK